MVFPRLVRGPIVLKALKRLGFKILKPRRILVEEFLFAALVRLVKRLMAPKITSIYFSDPRRKAEGGFSLRSDGLFNGLLLGVFPTALSLGLGTDRWPQAVVKQADQDWLWDYHVSIKVLENGLQMLQVSSPIHDFF